MIESHIARRYLWSARKQAHTAFLSLISMLGYLYVVDFDDPVAAEAANDLEDMTSGLSQKIWQKIVILRTATPPG